MVGMGYIGLDSGRLYRMRRGPKLIEAVASGTTIIINDAADGRPFRGLRVFGKSTQDGTPSVENPVPIVNVGESGSIKVGVLGKNLVNIADFVVETINSGTGFAYAPDDLTNQIKALPNGTYSISYEFDGDEIRPKPNRKITFYDSLDNMLIGINNVFVLTDDLRSKIAKTIVYGTKGTNITFRNIILVNGSTIPMIYSPYRDPQTLTLATPNGLPGIPVTTDGNYTDADGQQWICDEIDLGRGKYVQRTAEKEVSEITWSGAGTWGNTDDYKTLAFYAYIDGSNINEDWDAVKNYGICNYATITSNVFNNSIIGFTLGDYIAFRVPRSLLPDWDENNPSNEPWINWLKAKKEAGNPVIVQYALKTPIERDLTPEEIAAYKALRTYGPTTVVSSDAGAEMEITYRKDKKNEKIHWNKVD